MDKNSLWNSLKVRETFLDFFKQKQHTIVPSAPMVIKNDPTLMFTNAGMNQFKDMFLGNIPALAPRVADTQKCLRVSGKHNDLDEVGHDTYHHTMFEMLGNWSFGDYFKKEAIEWAWELLVDVYGIETDRIYATVFEGDQKDNVPRDSEAEAMWSKFLDKDRIVLGNKADNFWEMGESGPCGPCSEIHIDIRDDKERKKIDGRELVNKDHPQVIEVWNLVFMQFDRKANGKLEPLPAQHVDTGMGFERLCMVLQGRQSNYDTDVFQPTIKEIERISGKKYGDNQAADIAMRVIADHLRAIAFSIADGQLPSNVRAGYVIRRILRRAARYAYTYLDMKTPIIHQLVSVMVEQMGEQFPELVAQKSLIEKVIREEENSFLATLATGINLLDDIIRNTTKAGKKEIAGIDAFTLYDTFGFPIDLTELIARERGMSVDVEGFEVELKRQKERSRSDAVVVSGDWIEIMPVKESEFVGYDVLATGVKIARYRKVESKGQSYYQVILDRTPFYGNSGGQVGDKGFLISDEGTFDVTNTVKENALTIHILEKMPTKLDATFSAELRGERRRNISNNHTATHLLHEALRDVLGKHVEQKGSSVESKRLRFDFSHFQRTTDEELREVEKLVNSRIRANSPIVENRNCDMTEAKERGAIMLFGEKYDQKVRVVQFGDSIELCGGTHAKRTGDLGMFKILAESAISAGVRRIEAISGSTAEDLIYRIEDGMKEVQGFVNNPAVIPAIQKIFSENEELRKQAVQYRHKVIEEMVAMLVNEATESSGVEWMINRFDASADTLKDLAMELKKHKENLVVILTSAQNGKPTISILLGDDVVARGLHAGNIVREAAKEIGGGGGGQPGFATAGGKDVAGLERAVIRAVNLIKEELEK